MSNNIVPPASFCGEHPEGSATPCGSCRRARRLRDEHIAREKYYSVLQSQTSDAIQVAFHAAGSDRSNQNDSVAGSEGNVSLTVAVQFDIEAVRLGNAGLDVSDARVDVSNPGHVGVLRVEVKDGSVVVELHCHGDEPSAEAVAS